MERMILGCWSVGRMLLTLGVSGKNVPYIGDQWEGMSLTLVISGKNVPYIGDQWEECPYIGDWEE
ncbi:unnamed protein product [Staurois parvus]|uniref:Uncharacterized protein n=1 Tax=Staurois parvus TaxID=386267 RepID=A0ABN9F0W3_9NEOB|nr:unnamed protein product [Staurois parvus]